MSDKLKPSACPMDCPDACSLEVEVTDERITGIRGSHLNPTTQGFICTKVARFANRVYSSHRLHHPMKRVGKKGTGQFERISWQEALENICAKFTAIQNEWGGEAILPYSYGGSNGLLGQDTCDRVFFAKLGASRLARTVCAAPTTEAALGLYGKMPGTAFEDYEFARFILIWGANPKVSNIHLMPFIKKAKAAGAKIALVDPRLNFSKNEIDMHLPVFPGTDLVVALALIHVWQKMKLLNWDFIHTHTKSVDTLLQAASNYPPERAAEIAGVARKDIELLAQRYAGHDPAVLRIGWGLERNRNGGQAVAAILSLPALLGKFGLTGSGYTLSNSAAYKIDGPARVGSSEWNTRIVNMNKLGRVLQHEIAPPIKGLFVYNCNPVATMPNQNAILAGLKREDLFTVVFDQVMTDTAHFADILLPAVTFLEQKELTTGYGAYTLQYLDAVIQPVGEAKSNEEVFALLGRSMGWTDPAFYEDTESYLKRIVSAVGGLGKPVHLETLKRNKIAFFDFPGSRPQQFKTVFPCTPDGKIDFTPAVLGPSPYVFKTVPTSRYPLALISPATDKMTNSTLGEFNFPEQYVLMNSIDAQKRSVKNDTMVKVFNELGEVVVKARLSDSVREGVVVMPKGAWRKSSQNGLTATALVSDEISSVGGGACFNDARVEVAIY